MTQNSNRLRIALQKSGKLSNDSFDLLKKCGLKIIPNNNQLLCRVQELPIDILLIRDDDILTFIDEGICDLGILGENVYQETILSSSKTLNINTILPLGFSKCRLSIIAPQSLDFANIKSVQGLKIATSYPALLQKYLKDQSISAEIVKMQGSIEVAPHLKISDIICDIVSTGATLEANALKEVKTILQSQALLIGQKAKCKESEKNNISKDKNEIVNRLINRIKGVISSNESKYIMLNAPKSRLQEITSLLPGSDSPTIMPLQDKNKIAIHSVCYEPVFWETMEKLKKAGASAILVLPIEKMMN